jgi:hypothetical protein
VLLFAAPNAGVLDEALFVEPNPPNADPVDAPPPNRPPPVVELPNGFEPKAVFPVLVPKPPEGKVSVLVAQVMVILWRAMFAWKEHVFAEHKGRPSS